jgi:hypothetical protein
MLLRQSTLAGDGVSEDQRGVVVGGSTVGVLLLVLLLWRWQAAWKYRPFSGVLLLLLLILMMMSPPVDSTTLEAALASSYDCYDPSGASCTCTGSIYLNNGDFTGTIPLELSACTGLTLLCVFRRQPPSSKRESRAATAVHILFVARCTGARCSGSFARGGAGVGSWRARWLVWGSLVRIPFPTPAS